VRLKVRTGSRVLHLIQRSFGNGCILIRLELLMNLKPGGEKGNFSMGVSKTGDANLHPFPMARMAMVVRIRSYRARLLPVQW